MIRKKITTFVSETCTGCPALISPKNWDDFEYFCCRLDRRLCYDTAINDHDDKTWKQAKDFEAFKKSHPLFAGEVSPPEKLTHPLTIPKDCPLEDV